MTLLKLFFNIFPLATLSATKSRDASRHLRTAGRKLFSLAPSDHGDLFTDDFRGSVHGQREANGPDAGVEVDEAGEPDEGDVVDDQLASVPLVAVVAFVDDDLIDGDLLRQRSAEVVDAVALLAQVVVADQDLARVFLVHAVSSG